MSARPATTFILITNAPESLLSACTSRHHHRRYPYNHTDTPSVRSLVNIRQATSCTRVPDLQLDNGSTDLHRNGLEVRIDGGRGGCPERAILSSCVTFPSNDQARLVDKEEEETNRQLEEDGCLAHARVPYEHHLRQVLPAWTHTQMGDLRRCSCFIISTQAILRFLN